MIRKTVAFFELMRPLNLLQGGIAVLVTGSLVSPPPSTGMVILALITVWSFTGGGNSINDFTDAQIDAVNRPLRPIPSGRISRQEALGFSLLLFVIGIITAIPLLNTITAVIIVSTLFLLITYSPVFKPRPLLGNLVVSLILGLCFVYAAALFGNVAAGIAPGLLAFGFNLIREIVKDIQDMEGDRSAGARTLPIVSGIKTARNVAITVALLLCGGVFVPVYFKIYNSWNLIIVVTTLFMNENP